MFTYVQILSFLKNSLKFSFIFRLSPLCMIEEKCHEIKSLLRSILEQCGMIQTLEKIVDIQILHWVCTL